MVWKKIGDLVEGIYRYNVKSKFQILKPRSLMISLTYWCNSRCTMCNIWKIKPRNEMTFEDWKRVMNDPVFGEIRSLIVTGGEPSMYKDFVKTVKLFIDSMPRLQKMVINTNGFTPKKIIENMEEIAKYCQSKKVRLTANVSIDGVGKVHDAIRGIEGGFEKSWETVQGYVKLSEIYDFKVGVSSLILKQNVDKVTEIMDWMDREKVSVGFQIVGFHDVYLKNLETKKEVDFEKNNQKELIKTLGKIRDRQKWWHPSRYYWQDLINMYQDNGNRTTPCSALKDDFSIDSFGNVYYCFSSRAVGNFLKDQKTVGDIYFDPKNIEYRSNLVKHACKKCNTGCNTTESTAFDFKRWMWFVATGRLGKEIS